MGSESENNMSEAPNAMRVLCHDAKLLCMYTDVGAECCGENL